VRPAHARHAPPVTLPGRPRLVRTQGELLNQDDRAVLDLVAMNLLGLREPGDQLP
jgi:hypothetical protein